MARSFSLSTYLAFKPRDPRNPQSFETPRPLEQLIWLHSADKSRTAALVDLGRQIANQLGAKLLLTVPPGHKIPDTFDGLVAVHHAPNENAKDIAAFLDHWSPDGLIWLGGDFRLALLDRTNASQIPMFWVGADETEIKSGASNWGPFPHRSLLRLFQHIFTRDDVSASKIDRLTKDPARITTAGPLFEESQVSSCNEDDLTSLSEAIVARPVWLAAHVQEDELDQVLKTQRGISRISPRILLILVPDDVKAARRVYESCRAAGFNIALWDDGEFPTEKTDILLAENPNELGLFYRVSPVTLMGSSLVPGHGGRSPFEPASLGSAILCGASAQAHEDAYKRLETADALRRVTNVASIVSTLEELMAPDKVATMVHAGWDTVSQGAGAMNLIVQEITQRLEYEDPHS